jgi:hypothetical protein
MKQQRPRSVSREFAGHFDSPALNMGEGYVLLNQISGTGCIVCNGKCEVGPEGAVLADIVEDGCPFGIRKR